jgi:hypothetical protein
MWQSPMTFLFGVMEPQLAKKFSYIKRRTGTHTSLTLGSNKGSWSVSYGGYDVTS